ncbi:hypothetical protein FSP39_014721 [Pinctada imbricata]|uniref:Beta-1,4-glucuronyltransferase 1 n=1 Tax=Pinctada imbricata TaxID=66713 RepID=A0AA89BXF1_PINIB|nr:hypothetical protein FSP39_014721 [Pinctada imbricata]
MGAYCDDRDEYFIIKDVFKTSKIRKLRRNSDIVTIITQTTPNHVAALEVLAQRWKNPISVAIFLCAKDIHPVLKSLYDYKDIAVSFHFVAIDWNVEDSSVCEMMMTTKTGFINPKEKRVPYPFNVLRNVALSTVAGGYVFMTDIDMVPSANLHDHFLQHINAISRDRKVNENVSRFISPEVYKLKFRTAYVIPSFEAKNSKYYEIVKEKLLSFVKQGFIRQYAITSCDICQNNTMYDKWLSNPAYGTYNVSMNTKPYLYEPFYILHRRSYPEFDERFKDRGFNRISQPETVDWERECGTLNPPPTPTLSIRPRSRLGPGATGVGPSSSPRAGPSGGCEIEVEIGRATEDSDED